MPRLRVTFFARVLILLLAASCSASEGEAPPETCSGEHQFCRGECVDLSADLRHCGACDQACAEGESCAEGRCALQCEAGRSACDGVCVDLSSDASNCGACGVACAAGKVCSQGSCAAFCAEGEVICGGSCVDTDSSVDHCGGCDIACEGDEFCDEGSCRRSCEQEEVGCAPDCEGGKVACGGSCVDTRSSREHCGACGAACGKGWVCEAGGCLCPKGMVVCEGECVETAGNPEHCGSCGNACGPEQQCLDDVCTCPSGTSACELACFDLTSDPENCGACGKHCGAYADLPHVLAATCEDSACGLSCEDGYENCGASIASGCETHVATDPKNCGACEFDCASLLNVDEVLGCEEGVCAFTCKEDWGNCDFLAATGCETDLRLTASACGNCYSNCHDRPGVQVGTCEDGVCGIDRCADDFGDCDGDPSNGCEVDLARTRVHCGSCGEVCPIACAGGTCVGYVELGTGDEHSCVLAGDGKGWCWGNNNQGQLGTADPTSTFKPQDLPGPDGIVQIRGGAAHTCALSAAGKVWCWGLGSNGRLGLGDTATYKEARELPLLADIVHIDVGSAHACAVDRQGNLFCWGKNDRGQIGIGGSTADVTVPTQVPIGTTVVEVSAGHEHTCARTTGGSVFCWGDNGDGQIGKGSVGGQQRTPTQVGDLANVEEIAVGWYHSCARDGAGQVWCWGANWYGSLGIGSADELRSSPSLLPGLSGVVRLAQGNDHGCALTASGKVHCWGWNQYGQVGDGTSTNRDAPVELSLQDVRGIATAGTHTCARDGNETIRCWGRNNQGQLGAGHSGATLVPVEVVW